MFHYFYVDRGSPSLLWNFLDLYKITIQTIKLTADFQIISGDAKAAFNFFQPGNWQKILPDFLLPFPFSLSSFSIIPAYDKDLPRSATAKPLEQKYKNVITWT